MISTAVQRKCRVISPKSGKSKKISVTCTLVSLSQCYKSTGITGGGGRAVLFMTVETMVVLRKSVEHWKDKNKVRSEVSIAFFNREMKKLDAYMEKLQAENWKHNLVGLYFDIALSYDRVIAANSRSHTLYLGLIRYRRAHQNRPR